jgi:mRNA interferase MazF
MFERGDLLLVPYPFSDLSASKRRPVLALTIPDSYGDFIALQVTSRPKLEHTLALADSDLVHGALPVASFVRTDRIVTLNASLVVKVFGRVSERVLGEAVERFCARIGYATR